MCMACAGDRAELGCHPQRPAPHLGTVGQGVLPTNAHSSLHTRLPTTSSLKLVLRQSQGKSGQENVGDGGEGEKGTRGMECNSGVQKVGHLKNEEGKGEMSIMLPNWYFLFPL